MNFYFTAQNEGNVAKTYDEDVLEEIGMKIDVRVPTMKRKKRDYLLPNPNA